MGWIPKRVTVDEGETIVDAEVMDDYRWNGWLCPRMKRAEALKVAEALGRTDFWELEVNGDVFTLTSDGADPEVYEPDENGWYYPGTMGWCWESADPFEEDDATHGRCDTCGVRCNDEGRCPSDVGHEIALP